MKFDKIDSTILEMLKEDARTSFREIARKLKVSPDTISNRFERLRGQGIIVDSTVVIDPVKIGYSFNARFGIDVKPAYSSQVLGEIIKIPSVIVASKLVGGYDLVSIGVVKNFQHLWHKINELLDPLRDSGHLFIRAYDTGDAHWYAQKDQVG